MSRSTLSSLPPEIHLEISSYLTEADSITLSLTCKRLYAVHARQPLRAFSQHRFWTMFSTDDCAMQGAMIKDWTARNLLLPRLRHWIARVMSEVWDRDEHASLTDEWEICAGCASFKTYSYDWKDSWDYRDMMDTDEVFNETIQYNILLGGLFCESCCRD